MKHLLLISFISLAPLSHAQFGGFDLGGVDVGKVVEGTTKVVKGSTGIGIQEELSIGGSVALEIASTYGGVWKNEEAIRRVNLIGKSLAIYSDRPTLPYRFGILNSPEINAFSAPGGYVFITKGAYEACADDNQLAGILAHEIIHVSRRHALRIISRNEFISGVASVAQGSSSDFATYDLGVDKVSRTILKGGYDHGTEFDADRLGRDLAYATGFSRNGLESFLASLQQKSEGKAGIFSTHPSTERRLKELHSSASQDSSPGENKDSSENDSSSKGKLKRPK